MADKNPNSFFILLIILTISILTTPSLSVPLSGIGTWRLLRESIGISAMHMQLLHNNKVVMFDRTDMGPSNLSLPNNRCRFDPYDTALQFDCTAHSLVYDIQTNTVRPIMFQSDPWCSSGSVLPNGTLVQTGGFNDGDRTLRTFTPCDNEECDWFENANYLLNRRWYATNQILPDGKIIILGGRRRFNYEFYPKNTGYSSSIHTLEFLRETRDTPFENNLYPFLHLLPNGNLFIFANSRSISLDYQNNRVVREFPRITFDNPRNYPSTGSSVLLPLHYQNGSNSVEAEVLICGGAQRESFARAQQGVFLRALSTCGRLKVTDPNPSWVMEEMPIPRVMGDMLILPTGDVIIINGAGAGTAGWRLGRNPVRRPLIYRIHEPVNQRFTVMRPSSISRMYHSSAVVIPDGRVLIGGSNPNPYYNFTGVLFPTELSLSAYSPPYLAPEYTMIRPEIVTNSFLYYFPYTFTYGETISVMLSKKKKKTISVTFSVLQFRTANDVSVTILAPSFTTHSFGMNQRLVVLNMVAVADISSSEPRSMYRVNVIAPPTAEIAPPGYYVLFVVHAGVPSTGLWVKIQ